MTNFISSVSQNPDHFLNHQQVAPSLQLHYDMAAKGIVDMQGNIDPMLRLQSGEEEVFDQRRKAFLEKERTFCVRGMDLKFQMSWQEILDLDPSIYVEVCKKTAAYFRGFDHINASLKSWGTDVKDVAGDSYCEQFEQEIDREPSYICLQFFIKSSDAVTIADCKRKIINYIASKIPISVPNFVRVENQTAEDKIHETEYKEIEDSVKSALKDKEDGHYKDWIEKFENLRLFIHYIIADGLVAFNQVEPKVRSLVPTASLCLKSDDDQIVEIVISPTVALDKENFRKDVLHFPLTHANQETLPSCEGDAPQAFADIACKTNTPIFFKFVNVLERWKDVLIQGPMGETIRSFSLYDEVIAQVLELANKSSLKNKKPLGEVLGGYVKSAHDKMLVEESSARQYEAHSALALTMTACEQLSDHLSPSQMNDLIQMMAPRWKSLAEGEDDGTFFSLIAKAFAAKITYPVISSFLQLTAHDDLHEHSPRSPAQAWINERGCATKGGVVTPLEEIIQWELKTEKRSFFIPFQRNASKPLLKLMEHSDEFQKKLKPLLIELTRIDPKSNNAFEQLWIPQLEDFLPTYFEKLIGLLKKTNSQERRIAYFQQFLDVLRSKNSLLSNEEEKKISGIEVHRAKNSQDFCAAIFQVFGSFKNPSLNKAVYEVFKKTKDANAQLQIGKILCLGYLPNAINAYIFSAPKIRKPAEKYQLLETLLSNLKQSPSNEIFPALDLLAHEIDSLLQQPQPFASADWLAEQLLASQRPKLALKAAECIKDPGQREKTKHKIQTHTLKASARHKTKEGVAKDLESKNVVHSFVNLLRQNDVQTPFRESPQDFWRMIITPGLEKFSALAPSETLYTTCLDLMGLFRSDQEDLQFFASSLRDLLKKMSFPLPEAFFTALHERQAELYNRLIEDSDLVCELAQLQSLHQIPFDASSAKVLLDFMNQYMDGQPNLQNAKAIFELLSDSTLQKCWTQETDKEALAQLYKKLTAFFIHDQSSLSLTAFSRYSDLAQKLDLELCSALINESADTKNYQHFSALSQLFSKYDFESVKQVWQEGVTKIFIGSSENQLNDNQVVALSSITSSPKLSGSLPAETGMFLLDRLASFNPRSRQFITSLACACHIVSKNKPEFSYYDALLDRVEKILHFEVLDEVWITLKNAAHLSIDEKNRCFLKLLPKIPYMGTECLTDLYIHCRPFLDEKNTPLEVYTSLFTNLERNWKKISALKESKQVFESIKKIYHSLEGTPAFKNSPEERQKIQFAYARCLSTYPQEKKKAQNIFYRAIKSHFDKKGALWTPYILDSFKKAVIHLGIDDLEKEFTQLILNHPNHEAGRYFLQQLLPKRSETSMLHIGRILKCLTDNSNELHPREYEQFQRFCSRLNFKLILHDMTIFSTLPLNTLALECLNSKKITKFINPKDITGLYLNAYRGLCQYHYRQSTYDRQLVQAVLEKLPEFVNDCSEEEVKSLTDILFPLVHQRFKDKHDFNEYKKLFGKLNEALHMCVAKNSQSKERGKGAGPRKSQQVWQAKKTGGTSQQQEESVYKLDKVYFNFLNSMLKVYMTDAELSWIDVVIFHSDYLKNCALEDPSVRSKQAFNALIQLSLICKFIDRKQKQCTTLSPEVLEKITNFPSLAMTRLEQFNQKEYESFIEVFRMMLTAWQKDSGFVPPAQLLDVETVGTRRSKMVIVCANLLKSEKSELSLRVIFELIDQYFLSFAESFIPFTKLIEELSEFIESSNSYMKFDFYYLLIHNLYLLETKSDFDNQQENPAYIALQQTFNKVLHSFMRLFETLDLNDKISCNLFMHIYYKIFTLYNSTFDNKEKALDMMLKKILSLNMKLFEKYEHETLAYLDTFVQTLIILSPKHQNICSSLMTEFIKQSMTIIGKIPEEKRGFLKCHTISCLERAEKNGVYVCSKSKLAAAKQFIENGVIEVEKEKSETGKEKEQTKAITAIKKRVKNKNRNKKLNKSEKKKEK